MTRGKKTLLWVVAAILAIVAVYGFVYPDYSWRQKMTLELDVDGKPLTGSSVVEVTWENNYFNAKYATAPAWRQKLAGEATFVTLPGGQTIFALISSSNDLEYAGNIAGRIIFNRNGRVWGGEEFRKIRKQSGVLEIPPAGYPLLVTFTDINDPKTVKRVDPDDLAATFGPGVALKRITLEITDEAVTEGRLEKALPWLDGYYDRRLDGQRFGTIESENRFANSLSAGSFDSVR